MLYVAQVVGGRLVLILVVMEEGQRRSQRFGGQGLCCPVLILVVMEEGQRPLTKQLCDIDETS